MSALVSDQTETLHRAPSQRPWPRHASPVARGSGLVRRASWRATIFGGLTVLAGAALLFGAIQKNTYDGASEPLVYYTLSRADLPITVSERGSVLSQQETKIICEVETVPGQPGTRIVYLVPNGKSVQAGELLVEFDSAPVRERLDNQALAFEQAKAAEIQAVARFESQLVDNEAALAAAELGVKIAELELKMYQDGDGGTYRIELDEVEQKVREARNRITEAQGTLAMQTVYRDGIETLYELGYRGRGELDQARHKYLQAEDAMETAANEMARAIANRKKLEEYEHPMKVMELQSALETARRTLKKTEQNSRSFLAQAMAAKTAAEKARAKEEERLAKYTSQLEKCKLCAPHDGMVAYSQERTPWNRPVGEGELVVERFKLLTLPDLSRMQVKMAVHESVLDKIRPGLPATVQIDAVPDVVYRGEVDAVGVLPVQEGGMSSEVKSYEVIVRIHDEVRHLKPGMTALVQVHVDRLRHVLSVPVQAVVQIEKKNWCYVEGPHGPERRQVRLGAANDAFVRVTRGLKEHHRVVLNPMAILDEQPPQQQVISPSAEQPPLPAARLSSRAAKHVGAGSRQSTLAQRASEGSP